MSRSKAVAHHSMIPGNDSTDLACDVKYCVFIRFLTYILFLFTIVGRSQENTLVVLSVQTSREVPKACNNPDLYSFYTLIFMPTDSYLFLI